MDTTDRNQQKNDAVTLLHQTGADTLMGKLLRMFWQPIAISDRLERGTARALRVMGEDLTLYRGESGAPYLVGGRCAHRCTVLHTGWVKDDQIRCMYHGWRYDGTGQCTEMPAEKGARTDLVKIASYPVHEYCGLIFAYMGATPAPEFNLPRKDFLEASDCSLMTREQVWDCNWFQQIENSLDAVHVSFVHTWGSVSRFEEEISTAIPDLSYSETAAGILQTATRSKNNVRLSNWTFPNNNHIISPGPKKGDPWINTSVWAVPIDDHYTMRFTISAVPITDAATDRRIARDRNISYTPTDHYEELFAHHRIPEAGAANLIATQDYVALRGQGVIVDRTTERLMQSDAGIAFLRRIFQRELEAIRTGRSAKRWEKLEEEPDMPIQTPEAVND
jgi:5,5'-dehydrodivanillate O-demethylase